MLRTSPKPNSSTRRIATITVPQVSQSALTFTSTGDGTETSTPVGLSTWKLRVTGPFATPASSGIWAPFREFASMVTSMSLFSTTSRPFEGVTCTTTFTG